MSIRRLFVGTLVAVAALAATALPASANTGHVTASQNCTDWSASVTLNHNVTSDRTVNVITTIPGTTGVVGGHFNTSFGTIWSDSGSAPATGTVTLNIWNGNHLEFADSASLPKVYGCVTTTTSTTTTTEEPTTTTTVAPTTTTSTTAEPTTTTTAAASSTTTSTSLPSSVVTDASPTTTAGVAPVPASSDQLPRTGGDSLPLVGLGVGLTASGLALTMRRNRSER